METRSIEAKLILALSGAAVLLIVMIFVLLQRPAPGPLALPAALPWYTPDSLCLPPPGAFAERPPIVHTPVRIGPDRTKLTRAYLQAHSRTADRERLWMRPTVVVVHHTATPTLAGALAVFDPERLAGRAELRGAGALNVGTHYLVDRDGTIHQLLPPTFPGRHAIGLNHLSIGIENVGGTPDTPLTSEQAAANATLVRWLRAQFPIEHLIGHHEYRAMEGTAHFDELDPTYRTAKIDPGAAFMDTLRESLRDLDLDGAGPPTARPDWLLAWRASLPAADPPPASTGDAAILYRVGAALVLSDASLRPLGVVPWPGSWDAARADHAAAVFLVGPDAPLDGPTPAIRTNQPATDPPAAPGLRWTDRVELPERRHITLVDGDGPPGRAATTVISNSDAPVERILRVAFRVPEPVPLAAITACRRRTAPPPGDALAIDAAVFDRLIAR